MRVAFPEGFTWGVATAAYQVEGSPLADGAAPSNWHVFSHQPGRIRDGSTGDLAADHYRRWPEDVRHLQELGVQAYRLSIAWPRVVPEPERINPRGLDFYSRLVDGLLAAGIEPWVTLFHWDTPMWLEDGFASPTSVGAFRHYVEAVVRALGDRVRHWITLNEPLNYAALGWAIGVFPPGRRRDLRGMYHASHHLMVSHGAAVGLIRDLAPEASVGISLSTVHISPRDAGNPRDVAAARFMDSAYTRFYLDAALRGAYPDDVLARARRFLPRGFEREVATANRRLDFLGINYYTREVYRWAPLAPYSRAKIHVDRAVQRNVMGWEIWPQGLERFLARIRDEYGNLPVYITENGYPTVEAVGRDPLADPDRIAYLRDHLAAAGRAIADGCDCRGYFHWTLMDNFEWAHGWTVRFGLLRTAPGSLDRQWRTSAAWYRDLARTNSLEVDEGSAANGEAAPPPAEAATARPED